MKLGEALVKATRNCGELVPRYSQHLLAALLTGVKDPEPLVRASSVSNLGDVCQLLRFSLGSVVNEVCNLPLKRYGLNKYIAAYISSFFSGFGALSFEEKIKESSVRCGFYVQRLS